MTNQERYSRQVLFDGIGRAGQERLAQSRVVIIGCGALGAMHAETLSRAGVGSLVLVDRDFVEESNLQRQVMFEEDDARRRLPKAVAAADRVRRVNSDVTAEPIVADVSFDNVEEIIRGSDLVMDGSDNFEVRFLLNDACVKSRIPWIYGAVVGSSGITMTILPGETPCLRCVLEVMPPPGSGPTCDTAGVILPAVSTVAAFQLAEALKVLTGTRDKLHGSIIQVDLWNFDIRSIDLSSLKGRDSCPACGKGDFQFLRGAERQVATTLCGRNAVQVAPAGAQAVDFPALAQRLRAIGTVAFNDFLLSFQVDGYDITVFRDARSIIRGTSDPALARGLYARYVGQ